MLMPRSHVPKRGFVGEAVPETRQRGHGWVTLPVRKISDERGMTSESAPVLMSIVPLAAWARVFTAQVDKLAAFAFGVGSGKPKLHPAPVQSIPPPLVTVGPSVQTLPLHEVTRKRLVAPSGINSWGTAELPPPISISPQVIDPSPLELPSSMAPHIPLGLAVTRSRTCVPGGSVVLVAAEDMEAGLYVGTLAAGTE
jgi:hypothetical protein